MHVANRFFKPYRSWEDIASRNGSSIFVVFKHSPRCGISQLVLENLSPHLHAFAAHAECLLMDVLQQQHEARIFAEKTGLLHQSPQLIIWHKNHIWYQASHSAIQVQKIQQALQSIPR